MTTRTSLLLAALATSLIACEADTDTDADADADAAAAPSMEAILAGADAGPLPTPDLALTWPDGCAFGGVVPMGWERLRGQEISPGDPTKARMSLSTLPRLMIFDGEALLYNQTGYGPGMEKSWPEAGDTAITGASLTDLDEGTQAGGALAAMGSAEGLTYVQFTADWCAPCKVQAVAIGNLEGEAGTVRFVTIEADPQKWREDEAFPACDA